MKVFTLDDYKRLSTEEKDKFRSWCALHDLRYSVFIYEHGDGLRAVCYATDDEGKRYLTGRRPTRIAAEVVDIAPVKPFPFFDREPATCG